MDTLTELKISDIYPNPQQPRLIFKEKELEELASSIKENGLIQPIIVRKSDIVGYELIAGERRLRACEKLQMKTIPAIIKSLSDLDSSKQAIIENLQRSDLNPIEEALSYQKLIVENHLTHDEVGKIIGKSRPYVSNSLRLLQLPQIIQEKVKENSISVAHARLLLQIDDKKEQDFYLNQIITQHISVHHLEKQLKKRDKKRKTKSEPKQFIQSEEELLKKQLGLPVQINSDKHGKGKVVISFTSIEEFEQIKKLLTK